MKTRKSFTIILIYLLIYFKYALFKLFFISFLSENNV